MSSAVAELDAVVAAMRQHPGHVGVQEQGCRALNNVAVDKAYKPKVVANGLPFVMQ